MIEQTIGIGETIPESNDEPAHIVDEPAHIVDEPAHIVDEPAQAQANGN